jgi:hypothetical protein
MIGRPISLVFWLTQKGTYQFGLLIDPKSDSSVSKVVQQLPRQIEALQGSKVVLKQPLRKVGAKVVNTHPPNGSKEEDYLRVQKTTQCHVKRRPSAKSTPGSFWLNPNYLDYLQKFLLRVVAT